MKIKISPIIQFISFSFVFSWCLLFSCEIIGQNDTTNDTWRMEGDKTITDSPTIITNNLGLGGVNQTFDDGLHLIDNPLLLQRTGGSKWRLSTAGGTNGPFWIQNITSNSVNAFRIETNGRIGIGTGASIVPIAQLHVKSYNHKALYVQGGNSQGNQPIFQTASNVDEPIISVFNDHKLSINTLSPTATLEISSFDGDEVQNYSGLKVKGAFEQSAVQIINDHSGTNAGGLHIETTDNDAQGNALSVKVNRSDSPKTMLRIPNYSSTNNYVLLAEDGGNVGIGTDNPENALDVCGHIRAKEVVVESDWCDYVFSPSYELPSLKKQAEYIKGNGHLLNFESAEAMEQSIEVADVTTRQQKTIEEMMLYLIKMEKQIDQMQNSIEELESKLKNQSKN